MREKDIEALNRFGNKYNDLTMQQKRELNEALGLVEKGEYKTYIVGGGIHEVSE